MAYMSQERKKLIEPKVKEILKAYGLKGSLRVDHHSALMLTLSAGMDFSKYMLTDREEDAVKNIQKAFAEGNGYIQVNTYHISSHFFGKAAEALQNLCDAMNEGNWDESDIQTDYFNVGWYTNIHIGRWNKGYKIV